MSTESRPSAGREGGHGRDRLYHALLAASAAAVLGVARALTPSTSGQGTHEQLGLPPCSFHWITGHGCPGCGLTTSFAFFVRGDLLGAFRANPVGLLLATATALSVPLLIYRVIWPAPIDDLLTSRWLTRGLLGLMVLMFVVWFVRLALGVI